MPPDERGAELRELFFETSQELLQALNEEALKLEKTSRRRGDRALHPADRTHPEGRLGGLRLARIERTGASIRRRSCRWKVRPAHGALAGNRLRRGRCFCRDACRVPRRHGSMPDPRAFAARESTKLTAAPAAKKSGARRNARQPAVEVRQRLDRIRESAPSTGAGRGPGAYHDSS